MCTASHYSQNGSISACEKEPWYEARIGGLHKPFLTLTLPVLQQHKYGCVVVVMLWLGWMIPYASISNKHLDLVEFCNR